MRPPDRQNDATTKQLVGNEGIAAATTDLAHHLHEAHIRLDSVAGLLAQRALDLLDETWCSAEVDSALAGLADSARWRVALVARDLEVAA